MTKNCENSPTAQYKAVRATLIHDTDDYTKILQSCRIGKRTANFLACVMALGDLYGKVSNVFNEMYGEEAAINILKSNFDDKFYDLELELYGFVNESIKENIVVANLNEI